MRRVTMAVMSVLSVGGVLITYRSVGPVVGPAAADGLAAPSAGLRAAAPPGGAFALARGDVAARPTGAATDGGGVAASGGAASPRTSATPGTRATAAGGAGASPVGRGTTTAPSAPPRPARGTPTATATRATATRSPAAPSPRTSSPPAAPSGVFTGAAAQTRWGVVQVQITVTNGRITASTALQYPNDNAHSRAINAYALPILQAETLQAGSAQISAVSGATVTSGGYQQSLQSALDQAHL